MIDAAVAQLDYYEDSVKALDANESELKNNQLKIAGDLSTLDTRFGDKFGSEETSSYNEWSTAANEDLPQITGEFRDELHAIAQKSFTKLSDDNVADFSDRADQAMDELMKDLADKTEDLGQEGAMTEQEEVVEDIAELYNRYLTYAKYNYETEGAATITGAIAALAISTFVAIY